MRLINKETIAVFRRLWDDIQPYRTRIWWAFATMLGTALTEVMFPKVLGYILDHGFKGGQTHLALWMVPVAIIGIF